MNNETSDENEESSTASSLRLGNETRINLKLVLEKWKQLSKRSPRNSIVWRFDQEIKEYLESL